VRYELDVNGRKRAVDVPAEMPLLWVLRNELGLLGTKFGCGAGLCGACTVHVDGAATRACSTPIGSVGAAKIRTIEQLGETEVGRRLQNAWLQIDVMQCGYCQAGQLMSAAALLQETPRPTRDEVNAAMSGNLCRCACYNKIQQAIHIAAVAKDEKHAA
jgi:isoquinoline 1-oxidoreductase alpha subunit